VAKLTNFFLESTTIEPIECIGISW